MENARLIRYSTIAALAATAVLGVQLLFGEGSLMHIWQLHKQIAAQEDELAKLKARNEILEAQVRSLKSNPDAVEGLAREDLGMIRQGETYYLVTGDKDRNGSETPPAEGGVAPGAHDATPAVPITPAPPAPAAGEKP